MLPESVYSMPTFTVALAQLTPCTTIQENLVKGLQVCEQAKKLGADLVLFPEMWQVGYDERFMSMQYAIDLDNDFIQQFRAHAKKLQIAIAITYLGKGKSKPTNCVAIIDAQGDIILNYVKVHICSFQDGYETQLEAGNKFNVAQLAFAHGTVQLGAMICFDREFPESARTLMRKGAEIILVPNACYLAHDAVLDDVRTAQLRARAFENMVGIALTNYPIPCNDGHSCAVDATGKLIAQAEETEDILLATFDLDAIRAWREREVWADKYRRPDVYAV
jgi:predicted amidohydrolase